MAQTAQPAADILRAAPVFFPNQHVQAAVKRLPAIVTANTVFRRPVNFKVAERLVIKAADKRITIGRVELTAQVIFLLRLRAGHLPEGVNARGVHPAGETFAVLRHIGHAETQGAFNLRVVTAIDFALRTVRAQREVKLTAFIELHAAVVLGPFSLQPQRQLPERFARQVISAGKRKQRLRLRFILPGRPGERDAGQCRCGDKQLIQRVD